MEIEIHRWRHDEERVDLGGLIVNTIAGESLRVLIKGVMLLGKLLCKRFIKDSVMSYLISH